MKSVRKKAITGNLPSLDSDLAPRWPQRRFFSHILRRNAPSLISPARAHLRPGCKAPFFSLRSGDDGPSRPEGGGSDETPQAPLIQKGEYAFLQKPYSLTGLLQTIAAVLKSGDQS